MSVSSSKEVILKKIRAALTESTPLPFPQSEGTSSMVQPSQKELEIQFAEEFNKLQGRFAFCLSLAELCQQLNKLIEAKMALGKHCLIKNNAKVRAIIARRPRESGGPVGTFTNCLLFFIVNFISDFDIFFLLIPAS